MEAREADSGGQEPVGVDGPGRKLFELEREVKESAKKIQFAIDEARVAYRKAMQAADDIEGIQTVQNEIQLAFDENADIVDALGTDFGEIKEKLGSIDSLKDKIISAAEEVIIERTASLASAETFEEIQLKLRGLIGSSEEAVASIQDLSDRLDALAKDSASTRVSMDDVVKTVQQLKHAVEDHGNLLAGLEEIRDQMTLVLATAQDMDNRLIDHQRRIEETQEKLAATETALQATVVAGTEERLTRLDTELKGLVDEISRKQDEVVAREVGKLSAASGDLASKVEGHGRKVDDLETALLEHGQARDEHKKSLADLTSQIAALQSRIADLQTRLEGDLKKSDDSWSRVSTALEGVDGLLKRSEEAVKRVEGMEQRVQMADAGLLELTSRLQEATNQSEANHERTRMAARLVEEVHDKVRRIGVPEGGAAPAYAAPVAYAGPAPEVADEEVPESTDLGFELNDLLQVMMKHNASDLHLKVGAPPTVRLDGELIPVGNQVLTERDCKRLVYTSITKAQRRRLSEKKELDYAYEIPGARFRINAFMQKGTVSAAFRLLRTEMPTIEELGLPPVLKKLASHNNGLILVTGPAGSGKSTTLAALIDYINTQKKMHVITIEDPIEFVHKDKLSLITQREIGTDAVDFRSALKQSLRQDPNVILIGELRDVDTIMTAAIAAETGHLVFSTLHTPNTIQAIDRLVDVFSGEQQKQFRMLLSGTLRGIVSQRLLTRADEQGRVAAVEVLTVTPTISSLILEGKTNEIYPHLVQGSTEGMQTFTASLTRLYEAGLITKEEALHHADQPTEFRLAVEGHTAAASTYSAESDTLMNWL